MARPKAETRATTAGKWLLAAVVPGSALAMGSLPTEVLVVVSVVAAIACGLLWLDPPERATRASRWLLVATALLLGMTVLQAIPLPAGVVRVLAPANADIWEHALSPFHEPGPAWHTISVAPAATRAEVLRGTFYACVLLGALRVGALDGGTTFLGRLVVASTCLVAISALAHAALSADRVFGIYRPHNLHAYRQGRYGPLLNKNHLSAYLDIGACVAVGALIARRTMPRALSASAALVLAGTSVWAGSRGGAGGLAFGIVLTVALAIYVRRRFDSARAEPAVLALCGVTAAAMIALAASDVTRLALSNRDTSKVDVALSALRLVPSSPWFGVGRGGFEAAFPSVREATSYVTFTHPENVFVQWTVEWGVPVTLVGFALIGWALRPNTLIRAVRPAVGAWVAIVAATLSDLVDFHLEVPGIVAALAVCAAMVVATSSSRETSPAIAPVQTRAPRRAAFALVGATALATVWFWPDVSHSLAQDRAALSAMAVDRTVPRAEFAEAVRKAILRYPSEAFIPLMGGVRAQVTNEESILPWVARALERNSRFGRAHFVLARSLAAGHRAQARLEYRLAYANDVELRGAIIKESAFLVDDADSAMELVPEGADGTEMLEGLVNAVARRLPATAVILDDELVRRAPEVTNPLRRRVEAALEDVRDQLPWCNDRHACIDRGLAAAGELVKRAPDKCESHVLVARLRIEGGELKPALDGLQQALEVVSDRPTCQRALIDMAYIGGDRRRADMALDGLVRGGCGSETDCLELYTWAAGAEERRGNTTRAVALYRRALDVAPEREDLLEHIGELGARPGGLADALAAYDTLARRHPEDPRWPARIAELRASRMNRALPTAGSLPNVPPP